MGIDGPLFAAAFTHFAFLSLFPLIVFLVTIASAIVDRNRAARRIIQYIEQFIPIGLERKTFIFDIVTTVIDDREEAGIVALILLLWAGSRFLGTLVRATNRAWGGESHRWWRLPFKGVALLLILTVVAALGVALPAVLRSTSFLVEEEIKERVLTLASHAARFIVTVIGTALFYKLAPRKSISFASVWLPAIAVALLLQLLDLSFGLYLRNFASLSAVYGVLGSVVALLLWMYFSACLFIFGACLSAVQSEESARRSAENA